VLLSQKLFEPGNLFVPFGFFNAQALLVCLVARIFGFQPEAPLFQAFRFHHGDATYEPEHMGRDIMLVHSCAYQSLMGSTARARVLPSTQHRQRRLVMFVR
jgi:hypothetical protein